MTYTSGGSIDVKRPPQWSRDMAIRDRDPYTLRMFQEYVEDWVDLTTEPRERWGPLIFASVGGTDKMLLKQLPRKLVRDGAHADFGDGQG